MRIDWEDWAKFGNQKMGGNEFLYAENGLMEIQFKRWGKWMKPKNVNVFISNICPKWFVVFQAHIDHGWLLVDQVEWREDSIQNCCWRYRLCRRRCSSAASRRKQGPQVSCIQIAIGSYSDWYDLQNDSGQTEHSMIP